MRGGQPRQVRDSTAQQCITGRTLAGHWRHGMTQASLVEQITGKNLVFEDSIEVPTPIADAYRRWLDFPRFPDFMSQVEEVQPRGGNRYHWVARVFDMRQEWDAELTENDPMRRIAWRSVTGSFNSSVITFTSLGSNKTLVRVRHEYAHPVGRLGKSLDHL